MSDVYKPKGRETGEGLNPPNIKSNVIQNEYDKEINKMASLISDTDIERLEKVRDILKEIKELNLDFGLSNIIETESNSTLVFRIDGLVKRDWLEEEERKLANKLKLDCLILPCNMELDKAIKRKRLIFNCETKTLYDGGKITEEITKIF